MTDKPLHPIDQIRADIDKINAMPFTPGRLLYARLPDAVVDHLRHQLTPPTA